MSCSFLQSSFSFFICGYSITHHPLSATKITLLHIGFHVFLAQSSQVTLTHFCCLLFSHFRQRRQKFSDWRRSYTKSFRNLNRILSKKTSSTRLSNPRRSGFKTLRYFILFANKISINKNYWRLFSYKLFCLVKVKVNCSIKRCKVCLSTINEFVRHSIDLYKLSPNRS